MEAVTGAALAVATALGVAGYLQYARENDEQLLVRGEATDDGVGPLRALSRGEAYFGGPINPMALRSE